MFVLDMTFKAYGTIGTFRVVTGQVGVGSSRYCRLHPGTPMAGWFTGGTCSVLGVTQGASQKSGDTVPVRVLGVSQVILKAACGTFPLMGNYARPLYDGKVTCRAYSVAGSTLLPVVGQFVEGEGKGSTDQVVQVLVNPGYK